MSGTQSTLTDRTPNFLNKDPTDKKPKNEKSSVSPKHEFDPTGLVQRCVIIQRDENGFGLTVSGDNPVFVQLVKEDGAAMRAGVQTGDRIIKVNGTLVTHSNHIEVVKLIKSGSYVALTVLGRPPGLPDLPLEEEEEEEEGEGEEKGEKGEEEEKDKEGGEGEKKDEGSEVGPSSSTSSSLLVPRSPVLPGGEGSCRTSCCSLQEQNISGLQDGDGATGSEDGDGVSPLRDQTSFSRGDSCNDGPPTNSSSMHSSPLNESPGKRERPCQSPDIIRQDGLNFSHSPDTDDTPDTDSSAQCIVGNPPYLLNPQIIGAEDDYFDCQQEMINGPCSYFQSLDVLKSRPAHLAVFLHHVVSQFDPAPLLCYLYAEMHKQTSSKENRRFFMEFHSLFMDRTANLKVPVPEGISAELEKRRLELIPEDLCKHYTQALQETLLPDLHRNLEDFRQKRSMGLTLAEDELSKLDSERGKDQQALEKECSCAEHILSKIEDILLTSQPTEEEKCQTMQYVILTYMKHLGVKVKEPRGLEHKRARINFLPKIKKSIKPEKEGEEKVKKPRFPNILGPPRRLSRVDSTSVGKAVEMNKQRSPKLLPQSTCSIPEKPDPSLSFGAGGRTRGNHLSEGSDSSAVSLPSTISPTHSSPTGPTSDTSGQDSDPNVSPFIFQPRPVEGLQAGDQQDGVSSQTSSQFDFSPSNLEQLQEEDQDNYRMDVQCAVALADFQSEDDQGGEGDEDPLTWQSLVSRGILASLTPQEIKRQEVINELFYTERAHLRTLKVLDGVFYQRLNRDGVLPPEDIKHIFINLEEIIQLHVSVMEQMTVIRKRSETSVIGQIADDLLSLFSGEEEEKMKRAVGTFCSNQPSALELIKSRKKKDQRFTSFMQEAESNRLCRRLQLKDIIPMEMQRMTKYPLLLDNIAKYTEDREEREKVKKAAECCKNILNHVNQAVKEAENKQRLEEYQRRLDLSSLKQNENPMILELKNLDLTKRKMVHEGPLSWKVNKDKTIELYTILLEDILVLLQKQDERLLLKFHGKNLVSAVDSKNTFSPIIKLNTALVRPVATDNKSFFVLSMSENGAQIYELTAQTVSDQRTWQCLITQCAEAMKAKPHNRETPATQSDADAIEFIKREMPKAGKDLNGSSCGGLNSDKDIVSSPDVQSSLSLNPFDSLKSEDEEEELMNNRQEEEEVNNRQEDAGDGDGDGDDDEEVDEAELEAFLDAQLEDGANFLQEETSQGVASDDQDNDTLSSNNNNNINNITPALKAEEALRTFSLLKQALLQHMLNREAEEEKEEKEEKQEENRQGGAPGSPLTLNPEGPPGPSDPVLPSGSSAQSETLESNGGFLVLDFCGGADESCTDDEGGVGGDGGIDMTKLLSSSSQTGGDGGPNLSRQLMTYLRLLQADLQYLKEVEMKYNEQRQTHSDTTTDSDENNEGIQ